MSFSKREGFGIVAGIIAFLLVICLIGGAIVGWGMNIYKFSKCDFEEPLKAEIVRGIGIPFAPMGCIVGWFKIKDGKDIKIIEVVEEEWTR